MYIFFSLVSEGGNTNLFYHAILFWSYCNVHKDIVGGVLIDPVVKLFFVVFYALYRVTQQNQ